MAVTPVRIFNSVVLAVNPDNLLISDAEAVTSVPPSFILDNVAAPVTSIPPVTFSKPLDNVNNPLSVLWPIVEPSINTWSTCNSPPVILPVVVIKLEPVLIFPNPDVIEPASNAPTVTILELPSLTP